MAKAKSIRGATVDFDLMKLKQQISASPTPNDVAARQNFIEKRLRRKRRVPPPAPKIEPVAVEPEMPDALAAVEEPTMIEPAAEAEKVTRKYVRKTAQKARPKSTDTDE